MNLTGDYGPWLERFRTVCAGYAQAEEYVMVHHPAFRVGKKPFAILGLGANNLAVKVPKEAQPAYLEDPRILRTPYIGQHGWISLDWAKFEDAEIRALIDLSYSGVAPKPRRTKL